MRIWRKTHPLSPEQRLRENARSYARIYVKRGKLTKLPCQMCGNYPSEIHHSNYTRPLEIIWLCPNCHRSLHTSAPTQSSLPPAAQSYAQPIQLTLQLPDHCLTVPTDLAP